MQQQGTDVTKTETIEERFDRLSILGTNITRYASYGLGQCPKVKSHFAPDCIPPAPQNSPNGTTTHNEGLTFVSLGGQWRVIDAAEAYQHQASKDTTAALTDSQLSQINQPLSLGVRSLELTGGAMRRHADLWFRWNLRGCLDVSTQLAFTIRLSGDWSEEHFDNALQIMTPTGSGEPGRLQAFAQPFNLLTDEPIELKPREVKQFHIELLARPAMPYTPHPAANIEASTLALYSRSWNRTETI